MSTAEMELGVDLPREQDAIATLPRPKLDLFLVSFLILFLELAAIRWFGATVVFLTFFTNVVLIATFLGMSVGCLVATRKTDFAKWVLPLMCLSIALAMITANIYETRDVTVDVGGQTESPQLIYFGTEYRPADPTHFVIPIEAVAGTFFALIALTFIGLGQVMGRAFDSIPSRIGAYTINITGSLVGIVAFAAASWVGTSPHVWFFVCVLLCLYFVKPWSVGQIGAAMIVMFLVASSSYSAGIGSQILWSPYYKVTYDARELGIDTNNISHQQMFAVREKAPAYMLPYLINRDAGNPTFERALIIGAGSGNDVAAALASGVKHIDAVEIDPVIHLLGAVDHPDKPFDDERVRVHLDDGRRFVRKTDQTYDLAIYALVDSLVLHSGYSSLRLESFLFTRQAFEDVKDRLEPGGVFAMYNWYRRGWVIGRLAMMAEEVFGVEPLVISLPFQETITPDDDQAQHITFLLVGVPDAEGKVPALDAIRDKFAESGTFWINEQPKLSEAINGFASEPPADKGWLKIAPARVDTAGIGLLPTDNWPFLYLKDRSIPFAPGITGIIMLAAISLVILFAFAPTRTTNLHWQMFFLGAGFMLLETRGVVHMALLFGSTWVVNSVVFFAILVMILLANLFVILVKPKNLLPWYALLGVALLVNAVVPMSFFLGLSPVLRTTLSCVVFFVPVFFAGVIFATSFRLVTRPDIAIGSNIAGIILGGLSEHLSLVLGFNYLLLVALAFYFLSYALRPRMPALAPAPVPAFAT